MKYCSKQKLNFRKRKTGVEMNMEKLKLWLLPPTRCRHWKTTLEWQEVAPVTAVVDDEPFLSRCNELPATT